MEAESLIILFPPALLAAFFQIIKPLLAKILPSTDWYPLIAGVLGIIANFAFKFLGTEVLELVVGGFLAGMASCGTYDLVKKTVLGR